MFEYEKSQKIVEKLERLTIKPNFWDNVEEARNIMQELSEAKEKVETINNLSSKIEDIKVLIKLGEEESDSSVIGEIEEELKIINNEIGNIEFKSILKGEHDKSNAIVSIHPGAGGTESCDWASMLLRMYLRWAENNDFKVDILDLLPDEEAGGIKDATLNIIGGHAYGYLKAEIGVHRLVRISPFDASGRRHTSFVSVAVIPEIEDNILVEINDEDIRIDTFRASGAGGQHVNVTDSAIRITHFPTGIVVTCQNERSQYKNKMSAMKVLRSKLYEFYEREKKEEIKELVGEKKDIAWGSQIRSYVFHPYTLIKDHRTNIERGDGQRVLDGDIMGFMKAYLQMMAMGKKE
ncbi:MAG: peptide chain release factor 2 [bacterium]|nr:peptide chain release factor 2 [bacterium]